jgi:hypothetical protein
VDHNYIFHQHELVKLVIAPALNCVGRIPLSVLREGADEVKHMKEKRARHDVLTRSPYSMSRRQCIGDLRIEYLGLW